LFPLPNCAIASPARPTHAVPIWVVNLNEPNSLAAPAKPSGNAGSPTLWLARLDSGASSAQLQKRVAPASRSFGAFVLPPNRPANLRPACSARHGRPPRTLPAVTPGMGQHETVVLLARIRLRSRAVSYSFQRIGGGKTSRSQRRGLDRPNECSTSCNTGQQPRSGPSHLPHSCGMLNSRPNS
jgi:hypothetical protein